MHWSFITINTAINRVGLESLEQEIGDYLLLNGLGSEYRYQDTAQPIALRISEISQWCCNSSSQCGGGEGVVGRKHKLIHRGKHVDESLPDPKQIHGDFSFRFVPKKPIIQHPLYKCDGTQQAVLG